MKHLFQSLGIAFLAAGGAVALFAGGSFVLDFVWWLASYINTLSPFACFLAWTFIVVFVIIFLVAVCNPPYEVEQSAVHD